MRHPLTTQALITARFGELVTAQQISHDMLCIEVAVDHLLTVLRALRDEPDFDFAQLTDLAGVDYAAFGSEEWDVGASSTGFSRGVTENAVGRSPFAMGEVAARGEEQSQRYAVVYHLLSLTHNDRLRIKVYLPNEPMPQIDSVVALWNSANWYEREVFDLYGIMFKDHPDLRRILTDYGFVGHPLRKDFPLVGHLEVRYDPEQKRVIYQPVSIVSRVNIPRVIREDARASVQQES